MVKKLTRRKGLKKWVRELLVAMVVLTLSYGVVYFVNQQWLRQSANDPQIQLAEDYSSQLASGSALNIFYDLKLIEISQSLLPYVLVYDESGKLQFSSARLNGSIPVVPAGVLQYAKTHQVDKVTWQPKVGVRQAIVVKYYQGREKGYVVAGRSLTEVELREDTLTKQMFIAWIISGILLIVVELITVRLTGQKNKQK
jgi:hypothetical protein